ncbi:hypothetical protein [Nitritalea halalkaliphila]|uniref:hypothetical protein n=1 Tax=Nitritalea halalkaliphila TaxID=590849 RepID=UPI0002E68390|nr:hypothetical protein [Nitritalea halalkaliphila]
MSNVHFSTLSTNEARSLTGGSSVYLVVGGPLTAIIGAVLLDEIKKQAVQDIQEAVHNGPGHPGTLRAG